MRLDDIKESALMAFDTLWANKLRSTLTILGVSVGVVTVIFMVSIIQGLNKAFADQIESLGSNTIFVSKFAPSFGRASPRFISSSIVSSPTESMSKTGFPRP